MTTAAAITPSLLVTPTKAAAEGSDSSLASGTPPPPPLVCDGEAFAAKSKEEKLLELSNLTGYSVVQRNGQRIFGGPPPGWTGPPPGKGSEIFVGKVPRDCYEDELVPIFESAGRIYELRLMMDFSGSNRGYFFVRYTCREDAKKATRELNNYEIRPGKFLGVIWSVDNRKLWISGIPKDRTPAEIKAGMEQLTDGVRDVILYPSKCDKSKNRGYAFVEYESHRAAALARRKLVPGNVFLLDQEIEKVDWAEPENEVDDEVICKVRILFVRNLMASTSEEDIQQVFDEFSGGAVERVKKTMNYAFVHFTSREAAEEAMDKARGLILDDSEVEVSWSRPVDKDVHKTRKVLSKALTSPNGTVSLDQSLSSVLGGQPVACLRGAPGTALPAALLRKLVGSGGGGGGVGVGAGNRRMNDEGLLEKAFHHQQQQQQQHQQQLLHQVLPFGGMLPPPMPGSSPVLYGDWQQGGGAGPLHPHHVDMMDVVQQAFSEVKLMDGYGGGAFDNGFPGVFKDPSKFLGLDPSVFQNGIVASSGGFVPPQFFQYLSGFCPLGPGGHQHPKYNPLQPARYHPQSRVPPHHGVEEE